MSGETVSSTCIPHLQPLLRLHGFFDELRVCHCPRLGQKLARLRQPRPLPLELRLRRADAGLLRPCRRDAAGRGGCGRSAAAGGRGADRKGGNVCRGAPPVEARRSCGTSK